MKIQSPFLSIQAKAQLELRKRRGQNINRFAQYADSPVRFGQEVLGEAYTDDIIQVMESVRDNPVTEARSANAVGKTHGAARIAVWFYKTFLDSQVYTAAAPPEDNLKRLLWGEIGVIATKHPALFTRDDITTLNIERNSENFITGVRIPLSGTPQKREAKFSGKHAPHLLFIVDEGDAVPDEIYRAIESSMSGGHARLLIMFNPRARRGETYWMERDRRARVINLSAFRHPNVMTGQEVIPGAVDREKTVRRINEWSRLLAGDEKWDNECFEVPGFLVGSTARSLDGQTVYEPLPAGWRKITNPTLSYMVLGDYPAQSETQLISEARLTAAVERWKAYVAKNGEAPPKGIQPIQGQDVSEFGQDNNVSCFRYDWFVPRLETWGDMDPDLTATKSAGLYKARGARLANVDGTGVGAGVAPKMVRLKCRAYSIKVASSPTVEVEEGAFYILRDQLWWLVREWLRTDPNAALPPDELLLEELKTPTYEVRNGQIRVMSKDLMKDLLKRSPDRADALCLTFAPKPKLNRTGGIPAR